MKANNTIHALTFNLTAKDSIAISSYFSRFHAIQSDTDIGGGARPMADVETKSVKLLRDVDL